MKTVKVRVPVVVHGDGSWFAAGWNCENQEQIHDVLRDQTVCDEKYDRLHRQVYWLEVNLPVPEAVTVRMADPKLPPGEIQQPLRIEKAGQAEETAADNEPAETNGKEQPEPEQDPGPSSPAETAPTETVLPEKAPMDREPPYDPNELNNWRTDRFGKVGSKWRRARYWACQLIKVKGPQHRNAITEYVGCTPQQWSQVMYTSQSRELFVELDNDVLDIADRDAMPALPTEDPWQRIAEQKRNGHWGPPGSNTEKIRIRAHEMLTANGPMLLDELYPRIGFRTTQSEVAKALDTFPLFALNENQRYEIAEEDEQDDTEKPPEQRIRKFLVEFGPHKPMIISETLDLDYDTVRDVTKRHPFVQRPEGIDVQR